MKKQVMDLTGGAGVDIALETTASGDILRFCIDAARNDGTIVTIGVYEESMDFDPMTLVKTDKKLQGCLGYLKEDYESVLRMMTDGTLNLDFFITGKIHLKDIMEEGFKVMLGPDKRSHLKILVSPEEEFA